MISFKTMRIKEKILLFILSMTLIIYIFSFGFITYNIRNKSLSDAEELTNTLTREYANYVRGDINNDFGITRGLGWALKGFTDVSLDQLDDFYLPILREILERNPNFYSVWVSWELNALLPDYERPYGRVRKTYVRQNGTITFQQDTLNLYGDDEGSLYLDIKQNKQETITNPYWYSYSGRPEDQLLEVSPCIPLIVDGEFAGLAGTDIILERFQQLVKNLNPFGVGYAFLISNDGTFVAHPNESMLGEKIYDTRSDYAELFNLEENMQQHDFFSHYHVDELLGQEAYMAYASIPIGNTQTPWSFAVVVPKEFLLTQANQLFVSSLVVALIGLIILFYIIYVIAVRITKPLTETTETLFSIATGDVRNAHRLEVKTHDELGQMAQALNKLLDGLNATADFAIKIGKGQLDEEYTQLGDNDVLGMALLNMRESLHAAKLEEQKRKLEDEKRNWITQGQTFFADILRQNNDSMEDLSFNVIKNLVKYVKANQGGIFVLNNENKESVFLELTACYAYDRKKYLTKTILPGEGLVGACYLEKKPIYITDIPQDYVHITSGLGDENPSCLLLIPIMVNQEIFGVLELASFKIFQKHEIEFVEKVGENIASTISSVKTNMRTAYLLEQSQQQAEEMRAQEEEMRQNMEELHATQEEMLRKEKELQNQFQASEKLFMVMEYDFNGKIISVNENFEEVSGYKESELKDKHFSIFFDNKDWKQSYNYQEFWNQLKKGEAVKGVLKRIKKNGKYFIVKGISNPVFSESGQLEKVVEIFIDITSEATANEFN